MKTKINIDACVSVEKVDDKVEIKLPMQSVILDAKETEILRNFLNEEREDDSRH